MIPSILKASEKINEIERVNELLKIRDVYNGNLTEYIKVSDTEILNVNVFASIIKKIVRLLYQSEPTRDILNNTIFSIMLKQNLIPDFTLIMRKIVESCELYGYCYYDFNVGIIQPYQTYEEKNSVMVKHNSSDVKTVFKWVYRDVIKYYYENDKLIRQEKGSIYKYVRNSGLENITIEKKALVDLQIEIARVLTLLKYGHLLQCLNPLFTDDNDLRIIDLTPGNIHFKNKNSTIEKIQLNPHLNESLAFVNSLIDRFFELSGIPRVSIVGDVSASSAKELITKWYPLVETFNELTSIYSQIEKKFIKDYLLFVTGNNFIADFEYRVIYDKNFLPVFAETLEETKFYLQNNVITLRDLLKQKNPLSTDSDINRLQEANIIENRKNVPVIENFKEGAL